MFVIFCGRPLSILAKVRQRLFLKPSWPPVETGKPGMQCYKAKVVDIDSPESVGIDSRLALP